MSAPIIELVQLRILPDQDDWSGVFDQVEIWRSKVLPEGPYEELTGSCWSGARVPFDAADKPATPPSSAPSVYIRGLTLDVLVDGDQSFTITFSGTNPISYFDAVSTVVNTGSGKISAYLTDDSLFVLEGVRPGSGALLEVVGGDAAPLLGLPIGYPGRGKDARLGLVIGKSVYDYVDPLGSKLYYYKTRFRNSTNGSLSEFSSSFQAACGAGVALADIVVGYVCLLSVDGRPLAGRLVQLYAATKTALTSGRIVVGGPKAVRSDSSGRAEFTLVRGVTYTLSIAGTDVVRDILAPIDMSVSSFNMLAGFVGTSDDAFKVQVPSIVYAERRSL